MIESAYLADGQRKPLASFGIHIDGRLVEEGDAYVGELLEEREPDGQRRGHLLAARQADERTLVAALLDDDLVVARPPQRLTGLTRDLAEELVGLDRDVRDVLRQAGPLVTESYLYNISIEANQLFREITGEGGRALRWTKDYEIVVEEGGHDRSFINLSGGEQMVAALSVRLALLKQLSDIRVAFFDEPTVNMDAERRERLAQQIGQVRDFDQLFVISHDDTFEQTVDHVLPVAREEVGEAA